MKICWVVLIAAFAISVVSAKPSETKTAEKFNLYNKQNMYSLEPFVEGSDDSGENLTSVKPTIFNTTTPKPKPFVPARDNADAGNVFVKNYSYKKSTKCLNGKCEITVCQNGECTTTTN
jgi:hypothetical protein